MCDNILMVCKTSLDIHSSSFKNTTASCGHCISLCGHIKGYILIMAFSTTHQRILDNNIRHLYSGLPTEIRLRKPGFKHILDPVARAREDQNRVLRRFLDKYLEYNPEYDIEIPRAPAFRIVTKQQANAIVERVSRPTSSCKLRRDICPREHQRQMKDVCADCQLNTLSRPVSRKELCKINRRLLTPTIATNVRNSTRPYQEFVLTNVTNACEREARPVSQRCRLRFDKENEDEIISMYYKSMTSLRTLSQKEYTSLRSSVSQKEITQWPVRQSRFFLKLIWRRKKN